MSGTGAIEEVYVIKLKNNPHQASKPPGSFWQWPENTLGLGVMHTLLGMLSVLFGVLGIYTETSYEAAGVACGLVFLMAGMSCIYLWHRPWDRCALKVLFALSTLSAASATVFLAFCMLGVADFHTKQRTFGDIAQISANGIVTACAELFVAVTSSVVSAFKCAQRSYLGRTYGPQEKIFVVTRILGGSGNQSGDMTHYVSPSCVVSLHQGPEDATWDSYTGSLPERDVSHDLASYNNEVVPCPPPDTEEGKESRRGSIVI